MGQDRLGEGDHWCQILAQPQVRLDASLSVFDYQCRLRAGGLAVMTIHLLLFLQARGLSCLEV